MFTIRNAKESDVNRIRDLYIASYGKDYSIPQFYDLEFLRKMVYSDDTIMLVAEEEGTGNIVGTASVILETGAYSDLVAEFGRLTVHPDARKQGVGKLLMQKRLELVQHRIQIGFIEARVVHSYTQKISESFGFAGVGFLPMKYMHESEALYAKYFGDTLLLRKNNPRVIPEAYYLASMVFNNISLPCDVIVDEKSSSYPYNDVYETEWLKSTGYASLLRIERGRVQNREIFGPMRLHVGFFNLGAKNASYLLAKHHNHVVGAIGFIIDKVGKNVRVFELINLDDYVIRFLFDQLEKKCRQELNVDYIEIDVSAYAPRMQRTLLELNYLPVAYVPALAFHEVERLDVIKMANVLVPMRVEATMLTPSTKALADLVLQAFNKHKIFPKIDKAIHNIPIFLGFSEEQIQRLTGICVIETFPPGTKIFEEKEYSSKIFIILSGEVEIYMKEEKAVLATLGKGEILGEMSMLMSSGHSASALAKSSVESLVISNEELNHLIRARPDIGVVIYRNIAANLAEKLKRADFKLLYANSKET